MMNYLKLIFTLYIFFTALFKAYSQSMDSLSLNKAIQLAQKNSLDYKIALNTAKSSHWNYQSYKAGFLPKLSLNGTLPDYYRTINTITLPSGENSFVSQNVANSGLSADLSQNIGLTGGRISASSSLRRIDNFGTQKNSAYTSVPFSLSYFQNNLFYNDYKWQKLIEPLRLQEAQRAYLENLEAISYNTIEKYFELLSADIQQKLDDQNLRNIDTLVKITQSRFEIGTVLLNEVLQSKVSLLNAKKAAANSLLRLETAKQNLVRFLNLKKDDKTALELPDKVSSFEIDPDVALEKAKTNRKFIIEIQRRRLEAERAVARTRSETGPSVTLRANIGVTQRGSELQYAYENLLRNQSVTIGFSIPLVDWGVNKSNRKKAEANLELENNNISQLELSAEQEIYYQVLKWKMQNEQIAIALETRKLAEQRYDIAKQKYALGSISFTDFNNAQLDKDRAVTDHINNLKNYWSLYYLMRRLTLYDFEKNKNIEFSDLDFN
ncbi:outer membrane efflux protein [Pseudopedobacter saltans DSM 12145]|uniref:Outer membrane efflux protein n=1 Tax=Pseudopedobacter saltans (strain ATCC 51119 / DSM 12145 / JCM 21818 / CCUG 39354 / LMG 10337 / NBRC 100064 / NCIMB 13643) TaxID=762903 RepID=F0S4B7_PSESL|nr:TolC family protein [Pseudopedobacter saltans]ADY50874.1 outer membrane efflux protein [Pseudopedobacter saltans DSM 12145]